MTPRFRIASLLFLFVWFTAVLRAQIADVQHVVNQGVALHDAGKYEAALEKYEQALKQDPKSDAAHYEIAVTYFTLGQYDKSIAHCDKINDKSPYIDQAYMLKGNALDMAGKPEEAIKIYNKALKSNPDNYLIHYNLGYTYYKTRDFVNAEKSFISALLLKPTHPGSHLLLGYLMIDRGQRLKSILALFNFLLLEPQGKRAEMAYGKLQEQLEKGVSKTSGNTITINVDPNSELDEFGAAEMMVSLLQAAKTTEANSGKTEEQLFVENTQSLFGILGELQKEKKGFWWDFYVDFFRDMNEDKHVEALCYFISQSQSNGRIHTWLAQNQNKVDQMMDWVNAHPRQQ